MDRQWDPSQWMLRYLPLISCGKDRVRELMQDDTPVQVNAPLALMATATKAEISLLTRLWKAGLLKRPEKEVV